MRSSRPPHPHTHPVLSHRIPTHPLLSSTQLGVSQGPWEVEGRLLLLLPDGNTRDLAGRNWGARRP